MPETLTAKRLRSALDYNPETGIFIWRAREEMGKRWNARYAGTIAGAINSYGYSHQTRRIMVDGRRYLAHRLAWLHFYGVEPAEIIDHINVDPSDNRIANLRLATHALNVGNSRLYRNNSSGFKGVSYHKLCKKWVASIATNGKNKHLGYFTTPEDAHRAYTEAAGLVFGEFARPLG